MSGIQKSWKFPFEDLIDSQLYAENHSFTNMLFFDLGLKPPKRRAKVANWEWDCSYHLLFLGKQRTPRTFTSFNDLNYNLHFQSYHTLSGLNFSMLFPFHLSNWIMKCPSLAQNLFCLAQWDLKILWRYVFEEFVVFKFFWWDVS